jgi:hypothetical protein
LGLREVDAFKAMVVQNLKVSLSRIETTGHERSVGVNADRIEKEVKSPAIPGGAF